MVQSIAKKMLVVSLVLVLIMSGLTLLFSEGTLSNARDFRGAQYSYAESSPSIGTTSAFPGELVNLSYYLGAISPTAIYYEVSISLNGSDYCSLNVFPTYETIGSTSGYYLLFSFKMPNGNPGSYWNVGGEIVSITSSSCIVKSDNSEYSESISPPIIHPLIEYSPGSYLLHGAALFNSVTNPSEVSLHPFPANRNLIYSIVTTSWKFDSTTHEINVSYNLYEDVGHSLPNNTYSPQLLSLNATLEYSNSTLLSILEEGTPITFELNSPLHLVEGNGACISGITSSQMAEITTDINQTLEVPLSQLNAAVTSINDDTATIRTTFGNMTTSLETIDAKLNSISSGVAEITTTLGDMNISLPSINSTIDGIYNGIANISTSLGDINASLNSINASLVAVNGSSATILTNLGVVTTSLSCLNMTIMKQSTNGSIIEGCLLQIQTSLGNISGNVIHVSNNTAIIQTKLGTIYSLVSSIQSKGEKSNNLFSDFTVFDLLVLALIAATLAISVLALSKVNGILNGMDREKK